MPRGALPVKLMKTALDTCSRLVGSEWCRHSTHSVERMRSLDATCMLVARLSASGSWRYGARERHHVGVVISINATASNKPWSMVSWTLAPGDGLKQPAGWWGSSVEPAHRVSDSRAVRDSGSGLETRTSHGRTDCAPAASRIWDREVLVHKEPNTLANLYVNGRPARAIDRLH